MTRTARRQAFPSARAAVVLAGCDSSPPLQPCRRTLWLGLSP